MNRAVSSAIVVSPAPEGAGGLGRSAGDFAFGLRCHGIATRYVGPQPRTALTRVLATRPARRLVNGGQRLAEARTVRAAVPASDWDLAYAVAGSVPTGQTPGVVCIHQSTHHPRVEWERLERASRETGGRSDFTTLERRRREIEIESADLIRVTSQIVFDQFVEHGVPRQKLIFRYPGIDLERYQPGDKDGPLRVAYIGAFSMRKGVDVGADIARGLRGRATVSTVGGPVDRWSRSIYESAGFERETDVRELLARSHFLILPSRSDAFANVILEALACGTVPIVTPEVGASEIVQDLDARLVVPLDNFVDQAVDLVTTLDAVELAPRCRALAEGFERSRSLHGTVQAVVDAAEHLRRG